ncbi:MAG: hypothetical protein ED557_01240 [Balneola sp.]|nr:MAG: hypothetical protein ED557_01240 [Balneola sp.]
MKRNKTYLSYSVAAFLFLLSGCDIFKNSPEDDISPGIINYKIVDAEADWAPEDERIAYTHFDSGGVWNLYIINSDGTENRFFHTGNAYKPVWSPDGNWIAFKQFGQILKKNVQSDSLVQVTNSPGNNHSHSWSPDGRYIAFTKSVASENMRSGVWITDEEGEETFIVHGVDPQWISNEDILYRTSLRDEGGNLLASVLTSINIYSLTRTEIAFFENYNLGSYLQHCRATNQFLFNGVSENAILSSFILNLDTKNIEVLKEYSEDANWSADCKSIVYTNNDPENGFLWIVDGQGKTTQLTNN